MEYWKSKRNTYNNIDNIEDLAIDETTPEDIVFASTEDEYELLMLKYQEVCPKITYDDILVLTGCKTIEQVATEKHMTYDAYQKQLYRKKQQIKANYDKLC